jgi:hypothetical protein
MNLLARFGCLLVPFFVLTTVTSGCVSFEPVLPSTVEPFDDRPIIAVLPFTFDLPITSLATLKTVEQPLSPEDEAMEVQEVWQEIQFTARSLLMSRLAAGGGFRFVAVEQVDALKDELHMAHDELPTVEQVTIFRRRLGADLVVAGNILDYGKIRWQWLMAGFLIDVSWETVALGIATGWNPAVLAGNIGFELLTSVPLWFGVGSLFGVAMRPVRVEARAFETFEGYPIWQAMEESVYARGALKTLPETVRGKKETQLYLNLAEIVESLGDDLTRQGFRASQLKMQDATCEAAHAHRPENSAPWSLRLR